MGGRGGHPAPDSLKIALDRQRIEARRGRNIAKIAVARKLLTLVYHRLRDGHIRALAHHQGRREQLGRNRARPLHCLTPWISARSPL